jgi:hypothetical protein
MTTEEKIIKSKVGLLELTKELESISQTAPPLDEKENPELEILPKRDRTMRKPKDAKLHNWESFCVYMVVIKHKVLDALTKNSSEALQKLLWDCWKESIRIERFKNDPTVSQFIYDIQRGKA